MENRKVVLVVGAALFVGLMMGLLLPAFFDSNETPPRMSPQVAQPVPDVRPELDFSLKENELKRQLQKRPNDVGLLVQLGNTYFDSNRYPESIEAYQKALALQPENPDVLTDLGIMFRRNGQPEKAVESFKKAALLSSTHPQSRMNLGIVLLYDLKDPEGARKALEDYLRVSGNSPEADSARALIAQIEASGGTR